MLYTELVKTIPIKYGKYINDRDKSQTIFIVFELDIPYFVSIPYLSDNYENKRINVEIVAERNGILSRPYSTLTNRGMRWVRVRFIWMSCGI